MIRKHEIRIPHPARHHRPGCSVLRRRVLAKLHDEAGVNQLGEAGTTHADISDSEETNANERRYAVKDWFDKMLLYVVVPVTLGMGIAQFHANYLIGERLRGLDACQESCHTECHKCCEELKSRVEALEKKSGAGAGVQE